MSPSVSADYWVNKSMLTPSQKAADTVRKNLETKNCTTKTLTHTLVERCCYFWSMQNANLMKCQQRPATVTKDEMQTQTKNSPAAEYASALALTRRKQHDVNCRDVTADWVRRNRKLCILASSLDIIYFSTCTVTMIAAVAVAMADSRQRNNFKENRTLFAQFQLQFHKQRNTPISRQQPHRPAIDHWKSMKM